jgi:hypothetical protein
MAIDTRDKLIAALSSGQKLDFYKASATSEGAGLWHSLWKVAATPASAASPPVYTNGSGYVPTHDTGGAFPFTNPTPPALSYVTQFVAAGATIGKLILYDRLWTCSGITTNATATIAITTPEALTRPNSIGLGCEAWGEVYAACGATAATWTLNYKNTLGSTGAAIYAHPANAEAVGQMFPWPLQGGDIGISQPVSVTFSASSGTAGDIGVTILRRILEIPLMVANVGDIYDAFFLGLPQVYDDACLAMMVMCSTTNTGIIQGSLRIGQG